MRTNTGSPRSDVRLAGIQQIAGLPLLERALGPQILNRYPENGVESSSETAQSAHQSVSHDLPEALQALQRQRSAGTGSSTLLLQRPLQRTPAEQDAHVFRENQTLPAIQRGVDPLATLLELQRPATGVVQRSETSDTAVAPQQAAAESEAEHSAVDIEDLARKVYARLRRKMLIEAERLGR